MVKPDYVPRQDAQFLAWHDHFKTHLASVAASVGVSASEITEVNDYNTAAHTKQIIAAEAKAAQEAATREKNLTFHRVKTSARALARPIKAHPNYTTAIGQQLSIIRPEDPSARASTPARLG